MTGGTGTVPGRATAHHRAGRGSGSGTASHRQSALELAPLPTAVACARLHTVHVLHEWGLRELADDSTMIVSELVTNATDASVMLPERPPVTLRLLADANCLVIEVWDQSPGDPAPREADADDECGRGLAVVAALSTRWGFERTGYRRKVVWAEITV
jgi:anti-sigma regulatory factor (Ser/Thr protein kinase)